ncbi:hypothetical protein EVAR_80741_1 [Eumeta japonica]|uniref:ATP-dependent DNA helicase n=1 Tax=Eumeta variegata TaxID=151549 RepID=A0A4C1U3N9_EUMVA|nr:hypothetical protein EVAR_80741_1 [Eumeta japonica]
MCAGMRTFPRFSAAAVTEAEEVRDRPFVTAVSPRLSRLHRSRPDSAAVPPARDSIYGRCLKGITSARDLVGHLFQCPVSNAKKTQRADLSRSTSKARKLRNSRSERTEEQIQQQNTDARVRMTRLHQEEPEDTRDERNEVRRLEQRQSRRFTVNRRRTNDQQRQQVHRAFISDSFLRLAFQYEPDIEYYAHSKVAHRQRARCSLNEHNELLKIFKSHMHQLQSDNHAIVINPDKTPAGEHIRRFNAPVVDDVGIMVGDCTAAREIVIRRRNNNLQFIADTHRSYDALQYPLIFWKGQDGYCINIKQRDTVSGAETNKNVSSKDYYAYRLMIRRGLDNVILRCRELCQQFMVDMYAKIESERLRYLRYNQQSCARKSTFICETLSTTTPTSPKLVTMSFYHHLHRLVWLMENVLKNFPKDFTNDTVTNVDGYPIYRRRNPENGGQSFIKNIINTDIDIDNRWVVPYSPLLSKTYNAHINVEFCSSVESNTFAMNKNDEITLYQIGRYISSNEAAWRIFGFPIHERDPAVVQLAIHLENDIRKVNGQQYPTYKDACLALGLLEDDNQWECMLAEAALNCTAIQIRLLFAIVLTTCFPARAQILWENHKDSMTDDILHQHRIRCHDLTITFSDEMYNEALIAIEDLCIVIANLPLSNFGMNSPNRTASDLMNTEMNRELQYSTVEMAAIVARNVPLMNEEQRTIYDRIMLAVSAGQGGFFFLDAPGGTGKTFVISLILAEIRSNNGIALAVASSGIAATLLDGGRTAHSVFKLPLNIQNNPDAVCNIKKQSSMATVLKRCKLIIWDECTMAHKHSLEALNRTLKDIKTVTNYLAELCWSFQVISDKHFQSFHVQHTLMRSTLA